MKKGSFKDPFFLTCLFLPTSIDRGTVPKGLPLPSVIDNQGSAFIICLIAAWNGLNGVTGRNGILTKPDVVMNNSF